MHRAGSRRHARAFARTPAAGWPNTRCVRATAGAYPAPGTTGSARLPRAARTARGPLREGNRVRRASAMGDSITRLGAPLVSNPVPPDTEENRRCGMLSELADTGDSLDTGTAAHSALLNALRELSSCKQSARAVIDFCRALEASGAFPADANVRETITGPIMDAVFAGSTGLRKVLESGLVYNFDYTSKIARDLLLGEDHPDHVFEPQTTRLLLHLARGATHVLIGGAYGGDHALLVAQQIA